MEKKTEYQKLVATGINLITMELHTLVRANPNVDGQTKIAIDCVDTLFNKLCKNFCMSDEE